MASWHCVRSMESCSRLRRSDTEFLTRSAYLPPRVSLHRWFSVDDETGVYTQDGAFRLVQDHHVQKGPSFPKPNDVTIDATTGAGAVTVRYMEDGKPTVDTSHMDPPEDVSSGILLVLVKNLSPGDAAVKLSYLAATPKPRIVHLSIKEDGTDSFCERRTRNTAQRYRIHIDIGGFAGLVAPTGKDPRDASLGKREAIPAFIKSESLLYLGGPLLWTERIGLYGNE